MTVLSVPFHLDEQLAGFLPPVPPDEVIAPTLPAGGAWERMAVLSQRWCRRSPTQLVDPTSRPAAEQQRRDGHDAAERPLAGTAGPERRDHADEGALHPVDLSWTS
jgi:hypothetical protein